MCIEIFYTFCGLYASYCCCFCCSMAYTLHKEGREREHIYFTEDEEVFTEFS